MLTIEQIRYNKGYKLLYGNRENVGGTLASYEEIYIENDSKGLKTEDGVMHDCFRIWSVVDVDTKELVVSPVLAFGYVVVYNTKGEYSKFTLTQAL